MLPPEHDYERHYQLKPGDTYVEAGAFMGAYGLIASGKVGPGGKVILIEAAPANVREILKLRLPNAVVVPKCVWSHSGRTLFSVHGHPLTWHKIEPGDPTLHPSDVIEVEMDTLDNILAFMEVKKVDLLACDVEGAEVHLILGAERYLDEKRILNLCLMAYHNPNNPRVLKGLLEQHGYTWILVEGGAVYGRV